MVRETMYSLQSNAKMLKSDAKKFAVYGVLIALTAILIATGLVSYYENGSVSLRGIIDAQRSNIALWILNLSPFGFALWGQYVGSMISYKASALVIDQTNELRAQANALREEAAHGVTHDALTGLPNRTLVMDRLNQSIAAARSDNQQLAIILLDLDRFSELNSALSRHQGDLALNQVAGRLRGLARDTDTVGRSGADEFLFLTTKVSAEAEVKRIASNIIQALKTPFILDGIKVDIQGSLGISIFPNHGVDSDTLMQRAEVAMYAAKRIKSGYAVYHQKHEKNSPRKITLAGELRQALESGGLSLKYQPKVNMQDMQLQGVEALARWRRTDDTEVSPTEFVPLAERTGLIKPLTLWVATHAIKQLSLWERQGLLLVVSINISAQDLNNDDLFDHLNGLLASYSLDPSRIVLEITETSIMPNEEHVSSTLNRLADIGVKIAIDDFGTGYSSLAHLSDLPIHEIKIDRSFIEDMLTNPKHSKIVRAIINLSHNMDLNVIAEGVWNREIRDQLYKLKCDAIQGNYVSVPISPEDMHNWLKRLLPDAVTGSVNHARPNPVDALYSV